MFVDVPKGTKAQFERANMQGVEQGAGIGATGLSLASGIGGGGLPALGRGLVGSAIGSTVGSSGGGAIGNIFGERELGSKIGAGVLGTLGGLAGMRGIKIPVGRTGLMGFLENLFSKEPEALTTVEQGIKQKIASSVEEHLLPNTPLVGTPEEIAAYQQRMRILQQEAKDAGTYSAARGAISKNPNFQQRIKAGMEK
jgi:hypothetical protein